MNATRLRNLVLWARKQLGLRAQSVVTGELAKDLVKFEVLEIEKYLSE